MKHERKILQKLLEGRLNPNSLELTHVSPKRTLLTIEPRTVPGVGIILLLSHSCEKVKWWLLSKLISESLSEDEKLILTLLEYKRNDEEYSFFKEVKDFDFQTLDIESRIALLKKMNELFSFTRGNPSEFWRSFQPSLSIKKFFLERKVLMEPSRIGVGYKDKGSLRGDSCEPPPGTGSDPSSKWKLLVFLFLLHSGLPVPDFPSGIKVTRRGNRSAEEPQRAKR